MDDETAREYRAELRWRQRLAWENNNRVKELETILGQRCAYCFVKMGDAHAPDCSRGGQNSSYSG